MFVALGKREAGHAVVVRRPLALPLALIPVVWLLGWLRQTLAGNP